MTEITQQMLVALRQHTQEVIAEMPEGEARTYYEGRRDAYDFLAKQTGAPGLVLDK